MAIPDLNLVRAFVAIFETGSVSAAAQRLNITQPSVSHALNRLRELLQDPLFTRTRAGMVPTFNATQLFVAFKSAIDNIESAIVATRDFDPTRSTRCFRLAMSDLGEYYFLPFLVSMLQRIAPAVSLEIVQLDAERITDWLSTGRVDAVVGNLQSLGGQVRKHTLITETYCCLLNASHSSIREEMTLEQFVAVSHVVASPFSGHHLVEDVMAEKGLKRTVALRVPHFTNLTAILTTTDLVLTLPRRVAEAFAIDSRLRALPLPFPIPPFEVNLYWQPQAQDSRAQQWFCDIIKQALVKV